MNIDMGALHAIEVDRGISVEELLDTIKSALLTAYPPHRGPPARRPHRDRPQERAVQVIARETDEDGNLISNGTTPGGIRPRRRHHRATGHAAALPGRRERTRLRRVLSAREGDIVGGVVQRDARENARGNIVVRLGSETKGSEGAIRPAEQVPGEAYEHGDRLRCYVVGVTRGVREPRIELSRTHPQPGAQTVLPGGPEIAEGSVEIVAVAREAGHRSRSRSVQSARPQRQGRLHRPDGPAGACNVMSELSGEKIDIIDFDDDPARFVANARRRPRSCQSPSWTPPPAPRRSSCRTSSCRWPSAGGAERGWRPA